MNRKTITKGVVMFDYVVAGWDMRQAVVQYGDGNVYVAALFVVLAIALVVMGTMLLKEL